MAMEDICVSHLSGQACPNGESGCPHAHEVSQLTNVDQWVFFDAPEVEMLDFLAYKYHSHHLFKFHKLTSGALVRFATTDDARAVVSEYKDYYNPQLLSSLPNLDADLASHARASPKPAEKADADPALAKAAFPASSASIPIKQRLLRSLGSEEFATGSLDSVGYGSDEVYGSGSNTSNGLLKSIGNDATINGMNPEPYPECGSPCDYGPAGFDASSEVPRTYATAGYEPLPTYCSPASAIPPRSPIYENPNAARNQSPHSGGGRSGRPPHHSWTASCTEMVLQILRERAANPGTPPYTCGWYALQQIWGIQQECLDHAVLCCLATKQPHQQEQILLSFAAIDLASVNNLSAYLNCLIKEHETTNQVCLHFLAGLCAFSDCCYVHPVNTAGWNALYEHWNVTYKDLDYAVLNYLSKKTIQQQDEILLSLAESNIGSVVNLSAYLSSQIQKYESQDSRNRHPHSQHFGGGGRRFSGRFNKAGSFDTPTAHGASPWAGARAPLRKTGFKLHK